MILEWSSRLFVIFVNLEIDHDCLAIYVFLIDLYFKILRNPLCDENCYINIVGMVFLWLKKSLVFFCFFLWIINPRYNVWAPTRQHLKLEPLRKWLILSICESTTTIVDSLQKQTYCIYIVLIRNPKWLPLQCKTPSQRHRTMWRQSWLECSLDDLLQSRFCCWNLMMGWTLL